VHFATHALVTDGYSRSDQPSLSFSDEVGEGRRRESLLRFEDILKMRLKADLVVLSACRTNLGQFIEGEGLVGLSRAFFYAGTSSLVVSLWDVQDQSTSLLMEHFYKGIRDGVSNTEALRQAKLALMNTTIKLKATGKDTTLKSPLFWAPFIYFGPPEH
jgi:CHAT domain-containing protein